MRAALRSTHQTRVREVRSSSTPRENTPWSNLVGMEDMDMVGIVDMEGILNMEGNVDMVDMNDMEDVMN